MIKFSVSLEVVTLKGEGQGDRLAFGQIGAYSLTGRTDFNGHFSDDIVIVEDGAPPGD